MKNCVKCGAPMNDADVICQNCGTNNAPQQPAKKANKLTDAFAKLPVKTQRIAILAAAAAVAVLVLVLLISALFSGGPEKAIDTYFDATTKGKYNKIEKLAPKDYWEYVEDEYDFDVDELVDNLKDNEFLEEKVENYKDTYGKNVKTKIEYLDKIKADEDELDEIKDNLKEKYDISKKSVKKAYTVAYKVTIKGSEDKDANFGTLRVVKVGSRWYVCGSSFYAAEQFVSAYDD